MSVLPGWLKQADERKVRWLREYADKYGRDPRMRYWVFQNVLQGDKNIQRDYVEQIRRVLSWVQENIVYVNESGELFQSPWVTIQQRIGDCLPENTLLLERTRGYIPIKDARAGDTIWGWKGWTKVKRVWSKGPLLVTLVQVGHDSFFATEGHHVYLHQPETPDTPRRVRVADLAVGDELIAPPNDVLISGPGAYWGRLGRPTSSKDPRLVTRPVHAITHDWSGKPLPCWDITTEDGYVYLPEADVTVSNCDDLLILTGAMLTSIGLPWRIALGGVVRGSKRPARWLEPWPIGKPGRAPRNVDFMHIYLTAGDKPFNPQKWVALEPTIRGAPLGYDPVFNGPLPDSHMRGRWTGRLPELAGTPDQEAATAFDPKQFAGEAVRDGVKFAVAGLISTIVTATAVHMWKSGKKKRK